MPNWQLTSTDMAGINAIRPLLDWTSIINKDGMWLAAWESENCDLNVACINKFDINNPWMYAAGDDHLFLPFIVGVLGALPSQKKVVKCPSDGAGSKRRAELSSAQSQDISRGAEWVLFGN